MITKLRNNFKYVLSVALVFGGLQSKAQFSIEIAGTLQSHLGAPKDYPHLLGFSPRLTLDLGKKSQVGLYSALGYPVTWQNAGGIKLPKKAESSDGIGVLEFSAMYTYFFWQQNFTNLGAYGSVGPGVTYYNSNFTTLSSGIPHRCADLVLDMRAGVEAHVAIGWLFLEGRFAPRTVSIHHVSEEKRYGPLTGVNLGLRFLLNRHPYCTN